MSDDLDVLGIENIRAVLCGEVRTRQREHAEVEWRVPGDPSAGDVRILTGYPAVIGQETVLYEGKSFVMKEVIAEGFFDNVLQDDCHLNYVHESASAMARNGLTGPGGMELSVDAHGLRVYAQLPMDDLDVQRLAPKMDRGVVDQMSFAFTVAQEDLTITTDEDEREVYLYTLRECKRLYDVCVCPLGAYSQTEALLRNVFAAQLEGRSVEGLKALTVREDATSGPEGGDGRSTEGRRGAVIADGLVVLSRFTAREESNDGPQS